MHLPFSGIGSKKIAQRLVEVFIILVLLVAVMWLSSFIQDYRRQIFQVQRQLDLRLEGADETANLKALLAERSDDLTTVLSFTPSEAEIGEVVASLESKAADLGLVLQIPTVEEFEDESEGETLREVNLSVVVSGLPLDVLEFFYEIERLPFLVRVGSWRFGAENSGAAVGARASAPGSAPGSDRDDAVVVSSVPQAELVLDLLLAVRGDISYED